MLYFAAYCLIGITLYSTGLIGIEVRNSKGDFATDDVLGVVMSTLLWLPAGILLLALWAAGMLTEDEG